MEGCMIRFRYDVDKFVGAVAYFSAQRVPCLTKLKAAKLLYFADKLHLQRYGRPITGDDYYALPYGPAPTVSKDTMDEAERSSSRLQDADLKKFLRVLEVIEGGRHPEFRVKANVSFEDLSESETEILDDVIKEYGRFSGETLINITHREKSWIEGRKRGNNRIDFREMFDGPDEKQNQLLIELLEEDQEDRDAFELVL